MIDPAAAVEVELAGRADDRLRIAGGAEHGAVEQLAIVNALLDRDPERAERAALGKDAGDGAGNAEAEIDR